MEYRIEKAAFLRALFRLQGIADRKATMPILANVLLRTEGADSLTVAATDLKPDRHLRDSLRGSRAMAARPWRRVTCTTSSSLPGDRLARQVSIVRRGILYTVCAGNGGPK